MNSTDLSPGMAIKMDGKLFLITEVEHRTPGNLRAFVQVKLRDLKSGSLIDKRLRSGEDVEQVKARRIALQTLGKLFKVRMVEYHYPGDSGLIGHGAGS